MSGAALSLCVVVHDVAPATWERCRWLLDDLALQGVLQTTLLAVPRYHRQPRNAEFERWLQACEAAGHEIALHGLEHLDTGDPRGPVDRFMRRVYTRGEGEFSALDFGEASRRMEEGRRWLGELDITPAGFVAPAWLLGAEAWRALRCQPFDYTCTLRHLCLLGSGPASGKLACQAQVYSTSTWWRQRGSVVWNEALALVQRRRQVIRLELHPTDDVPVVHRSWQRLIASQAATRRIRTLRDVAQKLRTGREPLAP